MTQSVRAYLDERFESEQIKATLATDGVIGTNGGPSTPGTAYIMLHHVMGGATGVRGLWGFVRGGMGAISEAIAGSAKSKGVEIRTGAESLACSCATAEPMASRFQTATRFMREW